MAIGKTNALKKGVDTSDATATSNDILLGKTAYANDEKITGTIPTYNNEHENGYVQVNTLKKLLDTTKSSQYLFYQYTGSSIEDGIIEFSDTENVTNMVRMFSYCGNLTSIPLLDTSKVTNMSYMVTGCSKLTTIPLLNTSNVTNMQYMISNCSNLTTIPQLNTSNVTDMSDMFNDCYNLTTIPLLNTSKVTNMYEMFRGCSKLTTIPQLNTSKVTNMNYMFINCSKLTTIPQLDTSKVISMNGMFSGCSNLTTIPQLNTSNVTNMSSMFSSCSNLTTVTQLDTSKATNMSYMFQACYKLTNLTLLNIKVNLQIGSGTTWGHLLTVDSLVNTCKECIKQSASRTLTVGSANLEKLANVYVKFTNPSQTEIAVGEKGDVVVCESTDAGAMLISNYMTLKSWTLA